MPHTRLEPRILTLFQEGYTFKQFCADVASGVVVASVALPLAIAFGIASGVKPEQGLYTAIVAGFVIALLGGSSVQISGPTGAFIVVVYGIVQQYGYQGLAVATFIAGLLLIAMGVARLGGALKFIPFPLTVGFTSGIALIIFLSQIRDFFGLQVETLPADFLHKCAVLWAARETVNYWAVLVGGIAAAIIGLWPKVTMRIPSPLVALIVTTALTSLAHLPVDTIGSRFGSVPNYLPAPQGLSIDLNLFQQMFRPALSIALLGAIESLLSAVVADGMLGTRHRSNMELVAQGVGNLVSPLFLGIPATGAIARTAINVRSGGRTPVAGMVHAVVLLLVVLFFGQWAALLPLPTLAAILIFAAWNMSERRSFVRMFRSTRSDTFVMLCTFTITILIDLTVAIEVGMVLASLLFMHRMSDVVHIGRVSKWARGEDGDGEEVIARKAVPYGVAVYEIFGPLFFGAVDAFKNAMQQTKGRPKVLVLMMRNVLSIDASGLHALEDLHARLTREGTELVLVGLMTQPKKVLERSEFLEKLGKDRALEELDGALKRAGELVKKGGGK